MLKVNPIQQLSIRIQIELAYYYSIVFSVKTNLM